MPLIGWLGGKPDVGTCFNLIFFINFIDMVLNSLTQHREEPWFYTDVDGSRAQ